jgi:protein SCO1/2
MKFFNTGFVALLLLVLVIAITGCGEKNSAQKFNAIDITGADFGKDFKLTDHTGKPRTLADFKGKVVVIFFGYTNCPDVCPTTMSDLNQAMKLLGKDASRVKVLFVTVDPERDTQALLAKYVPAFNPDFIGLYGDAATTAKTAKDFRIFYQKNKPDSNGNYSVDHSAGTYVFDPDGKLRLFMKYGEGVESIAHDLRELLHV